MNIQEEHPRPGLRFSGVRRYAYLPNTIEGEKVSLLTNVLKLF